MENSVLIISLIVSNIIWILSSAIGAAKRSNLVNDIEYLRRENDSARERLRETRIDNDNLHSKLNILNAIINKE